MRKLTVVVPVHLNAAALVTGGGHGTAQLTRPPAITTRPVSAERVGIPAGDAHGRRQFSGRSAIGGSKLTDLGGPPACREP
jgi:hypothetical protein